MHLRTFKAQAAKLFQKANPDWKIVATEFGPRRHVREQRPRQYEPEHERESIHWRVRVQSGNHVRIIALNWGYHHGFWVKA